MIEVFSRKTVSLKQKYNGRTKSKMPLTSSTIIKSTTLHSWGCNRGHISAIKKSESQPIILLFLCIFFFNKIIGLTTFTSSLLRQHCVGLMTHIHTKQCQLASHKAPGSFSLGWAKQWTTLSPAASPESRVKLPAVSVRTGKRTSNRNTRGSERLMNSKLDK